MKQKVKHLQDETELPRLKSTKIKNYTTLKKIILIIFLFLNGIFNSPTEMATATVRQRAENITINKIASNEEYTAFVRSQINEQLIQEVQTFITQNSPTSQVTGKEIVRVCHIYNLDIVFVLAQGYIESHLGTKGLAYKTNSVFNVGTYDGGRILYTYKNPNESIEPYAKLLNEKYLVDKTINNLVMDRGFKNVEGYRYATSTSYEQQLRTMMVKISLETNISMYQDIFNLSDEKIISYFKPEIETQTFELIANI